MSNTSKIKAYTDRFGLVTSVPIMDDDHLLMTLCELSATCKIVKAYLTTGKKSREILFTQWQNENRPTHYTRADGVHVATLSIHPHNYPMTAHYPDGSEKIIY